MAAMSSPSQILLQQANALWQQGNGPAAEPLYRALLAAQPAHDEAAHNLGLLLAQRGAHAESLPLFQAALKVRPGIGQYWLSYANALLATDHAREARIVLSRAQQSGFESPALNELLAKADAAQTPSDADRRMEIGTALAAQGRMADAIAAYREALQHAPDHAETHFRLGSLLSETGQVAEGFAHYMRRATLVHAGPARRPNKPAPEHRLKHDFEQSDYLTGKSDAQFHLEDGGRLPGPAINPANATLQLLEQWHESWPQMVVLENFLMPEALEKLRRYCAGSTIWKRNYEAGYIGATPEDGLACPLMAQIAEEISATFPGILGAHHFHYLGAFKYDSALSTGTNTHADNSAVNVNFYIAPDEANLDPESGGMDIWDVAVPAGEDMRIYNGSESAARDFLEKSRARLTRVPHRANRAVIFKSDLFHKTSDCRFAEGYLNKRINISLLFGNRGAPTSAAGR
jgi:tetratricopeptide (TPR) repeat protein